FIDQTYTPPLLVHVNQHTFALVTDHLHGLMQLRAAITSAGTKDIPSNAGAMHPYQDRLVRLPCTLYQGKVMLAGVELGISYHVKIAPLGWHFDCNFFMNKCFSGEAILNQILNGHD